MNNPVITQETVDRAREFAERAHGEQRYGEYPYIRHLDAVAEICRPFGFVYEVVAYLHDVLEDTDVGRWALKDEFGEEVTSQVEFITDPAGPNRKARKYILYERLTGAGTKYQVALVVKTADRLANMRESARSNPAMLQMYQREHGPFRRACCRVGVCEPLWRELDRLAGPQEGWWG
jgi:(p)ppGpp synthase/HD superfamily hydrolase